MSITLDFAPYVDRKQTNWQLLRLTFNGDITVLQPSPLPDPFGTLANRIEAKLRERMSEFSAKTMKLITDVLFHSQAVNKSRNQSSLIRTFFVPGVEINRVPQDCDPGDDVALEPLVRVVPWDGNLLFTHRRCR